MYSAFLTCLVSIIQTPTLTRRLRRRRNLVLAFLGEHNVSSGLPISTFVYANKTRLTSTDAEAEAYIQSNYFPSVSLDDLAPVFEAYPSDPRTGSPFDTGLSNNITAQFKRISAIQGDLIFQALRRFFLDQRSSKQKTWAYRELREGLNNQLYYADFTSHCDQYRNA